MGKKYIVIFIFIFVLVAGLGFLFFLQTPNQPSPDRIRVVASFYPLAFFASEIGGNLANVTTITPAGAEPHDYEPTAQDIARIEESNVLVLNGGGLEAWSAKISQNIDPHKTTLVNAGDGLTTQQTTEGDNSITDPHIWLNPLLVQKMADAILQGFVAADPTHRDFYGANTAILKIKLTELDAAYHSGLQYCTHKDIITSHAAFGYLASRYNLNQVPIAGLSPDEEPSPARLAEIAQFAKKNNIEYIFFESLVSPKLSETIAREIGAKTLVLNPLEGMSYPETMRGKNYFTEMLSNLNNLELALQCKP